MGFLKKFTDKLTAPDSSVHLRFDCYSVPLGDNLQGTLNIASKEDFETTEVRCEIACVERAKVIKQVYDATLKRSIPQVVEESTVIYSAKPAFSGLLVLSKEKPAQFLLILISPQEQDKLMLE